MQQCGGELSTLVSGLSIHKQSVENVKELARGLLFLAGGWRGTLHGMVATGAMLATRESLITKIAQQRKFTDPLEMKC